MANPAQHLDPSHFLNRELSWLEFNQRVLNEALDPCNPLLERVKFFCITSSNLDEFFEVRVAGLKQQVESEVVGRSIDGRTASEILQAITKRVRRMVLHQYKCWRQDLVPALARHGIRFLEIDQLSRESRKWIEKFYRTQIRPVLTPLAIDPAHPFPQLLNKSLNIIVHLEMTKDGETLRHLAVVQVPRVLPRLVKLPDSGGQQYIYLGKLIGHFLSNLFPGTTILGYWHFRVTRNSELYIDEGDIGNLLNAVETELHNRRKGDAVRLELEKGCPHDICRALLATLGLTYDDLYVIDGPLNPTRLMAIYEGDHSPELRDPPFIARPAEALRDNPDVFAAIRKRDILLHHPYENFSSIVDFLDTAAKDPQVLAIKQTLYRTGGDPRIIGALINAANNGKHVTAVVELRARFDEAKNIEWSRRLEEAGVHVVYGLVGYKIHCKMLLVVRKEDSDIRRYLHLSTGNYNPTTAKMYTDVGLLTCRSDFGEDATNLFNLLTGVCQFQETERLIVAPFQLHDRMLQLIQREKENALAGLPARIIAKMNSLVDEHIINALYDASQAGVKIDLIVRGICCLRPQVPGLSENITVRSIVDRFLEHSRIFYFENACQPETFVGSADWMPRNFFRRIEAIFPVVDGTLSDRIKRDLLDIQLADNTRVNLLKADGSYERPVKKENSRARRSQVEAIKISLGVTEKKTGTTAKTRYPKVKLLPRPSKR
jgi:polyphosphate kinase